MGIMVARRTMVRNLSRRSKLCYRLYYRNLIVIFLLCIAALAQSDVSISTTGPFTDLTRNASWGSGGIVGIENAYIFVPPTAQSVGCVYIANKNPTNAHTFTITLRSTGDQTVSKFFSGTTADQGKWRTLNTISDTVAAASVNVYSVSELAAARAMVQISGTGVQAGNPDTADIYIVHAQTNVDCSTLSIPVNGNVTINNSTTTPSCNNQATATVNSASTTTLVSAAPSGQVIKVCAFSAGGDVTANGLTVLFQTGTAGSCAAPGATVWAISPHTGGGNFNLGAGLGQLFKTTTAAQPLCLTAGAIGAPTVVSVSFIYAP